MIGKMHTFDTIQALHRVPGTDVPKTVKDVENVCQQDWHQFLL